MFNSNERPSTTTLRRLLNGDLSRREAEALREVLRADPDARRKYDRLVNAERALEGDDHPGLGPGAKARVQARLMQNLPASEARSFRWPSLGLALAAAAAAVAVVIVQPRDGSLPGDGSLSTDEFTPRSGGPAANISSDYVLQVLHIAAGSDGGIDIRPAEQLAPSDELRFAAFVRDTACRVSVVAVREDGQRKVLLSRARIAPQARSQRLELAWTVPSGWLGQVNFVGVFEFGEPEDLALINLDARDEDGLSVRVVRTSVGGRQE